jgi:hypothetical protein
MKEKNKYSNVVRKSHEEWLFVIIMKGYSGTLG